MIQLIFCLYLLFPVQSNILIEHPHDYISVDHLGNVFAVSNTEIVKFDSKGEKIASFSNSMLGVMFGLLKGLIILSIVVHLANYIDKKFDFISEEKKAESILYEPMVIISETLFDIFDSDFASAKDKIKEKVQKELPVEV